MTSQFGNPSSVHGRGEQARRLLAEARGRVARLINGFDESVVFTSSGTEANNMVLFAHITRTVGQPRIITTETEHSSIINMCQELDGGTVDAVFLPVDHRGLVDLDRLRHELQSPTGLVSVQWVNNETGVIQPIREIAHLCREMDVPVHTDAAQAVGKLPVDIQEIRVDYLTFTAHKFHGPQGVGAVHTSSARRLGKVFFGGDQERGLRPGTENLPAIVGLGTAAKLRHESLAATVDMLGALRDRFEAMILEQMPGVRINGGGAPRVCNTSNILFSGVDGQALVALLDQRGLRVSQSSACTNMLPEASYVLQAMGLDEDEAYSSVRFSFSVHNHMDELEVVVGHVRELCSQLTDRDAQAPVFLGGR